MSLGRIVGPIWAGFIFDVNVNYPYLSGAVIMFIGFLFSLVWVSQGREETTSASPKVGRRSGALKHPTDTTKPVKTG